ncbi:hypothetical protein B0T24DRAFT_586262 [Lasiosphaeria ovina]|uniref:Uncharacterized protein n=1 Tax=Lasiosphaeria ovina TaxID=92902 RepID=A0AAE0MZ20_9PEZI|nr:hypothetical protein B0T24DRAFT_586262 [Lasiosphaeria ovina]
MDPARISTTGTGFEERAYENGVLDPIASYVPGDASTHDRDVQHHRRTSTQPSEDAYQRFCNRIARSKTEADASALLDKHMMKDYDLPYDSIRNATITNTPNQDSRDFNYGLSDPRPNFLQGISVQDLPSHLQHHSLHREEPGLAFSHLAVEFKKRDGNLYQATYQAAYDGAVLVHARERALAEARARTPDGTAAAAALDRAAAETAVLTCVTDGQVADVYRHHHRDGQYHQTLVGRESLIFRPRRGRSLIRNAQDWAWRKAYQLARLMGANLGDVEEEEE